MEISNAITLSIIWHFKNEIEAKLVRLYFLILNQIPKVVILKVAIEVDQGAPTFWMHRSLEVNVTLVILVEIHDNCTSRNLFY